MISRWLMKPGTRIRSVGPSPKLAYAIETSPFFA